MRVEPVDRWALYDKLVAGIPADLEITDALANRWSAVRTETGDVGLGMVYDGGPAAPTDAWNVRGRRLREVAGYAKSWDLRLASLGVAALNAWYATPARLRATPGVIWGPDANFFRRHAAALGVRKTAVIGHFPDVDELSGDLICLERRPRGADLPDAACEFVLPGRELVAITGSTVVNKTLPRLLELASAAEVHIVGPTAPPAADAYPDCVVEIAGSVVIDPEVCWQRVALGIRHLADTPALEMFSYPLHPTGPLEGEST